MKEYYVCVCLAVLLGVDSLYTVYVYKEVCIFGDGGGGGG